MVMGDAANDGLADSPHSNTIRVQGLSYKMGKFALRVACKPHDHWLATLRVKVCLLPAVTSR